jgi:hypothetical protein
MLLLHLLSNLVGITLFVGVSVRINELPIDEVVRNMHGRTQGNMLIMQLAHAWFLAIFVLNCLLIFLLAYSNRSNLVYI